MKDYRASTRVITLTMVLDKELDNCSDVCCVNIYRMMILSTSPVPVINSSLDFSANFMH
jgi:hypothetical protein